MKRHRLALWGFFGFAVLCSIVLFGLYCSQRTLIYAPKKYTADEESAILNRLGLDPNCQIDLISADKTRIRAYWIPSINPNKAPTVLYLHGNTGKIEWGLNAGLEWRRSIGVNSLVISYRGFGCSGGSPNMDGIRKDSQAALDHLLSRSDIDKDKIVLFGHSLGGAVALHLAADNADKVAAVIVENTFVRLSRVVFSNSNAASIIEPIIVDPWDNEHPIEHLLRRGEAGKKVPHVLFLSGRKDNIVAPWHMDHLWSKFEQGSKSFIRTFHHFAEGGHTCHREPNYHRRIDAFLRTIFEK